MSEDILETAKYVLGKRDLFGSQDRDEHSENCEVWHTHCLVKAMAAEIARLRGERLTAGEREALELSLELEWPKTGRQWKALAACLGPVCVAPANEHKVAIRGLLDRQPLPPGPEPKEVNRE